MNVTMDGQELPPGTINLGYDKVAKALETIVYCEKHPTWRERFWRWLRRQCQRPRVEREEPYLTLTVVGAHGHQSAQAKLLRNAQSSLWDVSDGRATNAAPIMLDLTVDGQAPCGAHWLITDECGVLLYEGQFRRAIQGCEIPADWLVVRE